MLELGAAELRTAGIATTEAVTAHAAIAATAKRFMLVLLEDELPTKHGLRRAGGERLASMPDVVIKVRENGPYLVKGPVTLIDAEGNEYAIEGENFVLCRCGGSSTKPFCDGTHRTNEFCATERALAQQQQQEQ